MKSNLKKSSENISFPFIANNWLKEIKFAHEHMAKSLAANMYPLSQMNNILANWQASQKAIFAQIDPWLQVQKVFSEQLIAVSEGIRKAFASIDFDQLQKVAKSLADEGVRLNVLIKTGWWYCPSMVYVGAEAIKNAAIKFNNGDKKAMTNLMVFSYHKNKFELLKSTVASWENNIFFKKRMNIIKDALEAHIEGKYTLSIPTLLPLVEGIASDYCKSKKISLSGIRSKGNAKVEKAFADLLSSKGYPFKFPDLFIDILNNVIYQDTSRTKDPFRKKLNRHGVLHGNYIRYYDCPRSLRCFLLLDAISALK